MQKAPKFRKSIDLQGRIDKKFKGKLGGCKERK